MNSFYVNIKLYTDDTVIYTSESSTQEIKTSLQECLDYVDNWCNLNRLYMNMKKTKIQDVVFICSVGSRTFNSE